MSHYILDIETRPNEEFLPLFESEIKPDGRIKDPIKQAASIKLKAQETYHKSMAVDTDFSEIICIGIKELGKPSKLYNAKEFEQFFIDNSDITFVTFNGKAFDLPIIIKTGIRTGMNLPYSKLTKMTKKYQDNDHHDLAQLLSFNGTKFKKLDTYLRIYLNTQKETLGDDFFRNATVEEIKQHCLEDLQFTEDLFLKFSFLLQGDE